MRKIETWNSGWYFAWQDCGPGFALDHGEAVTLPHTWNARDGQDGGNDYYRGRCWYVKKFMAPVLDREEQLWLEFEGAAMTAEVYLNGQKLARHAGGYSTFRVELTPLLAAGENLLAVSVDNGKNDTIYPQKADFTFYGGLYRDVNLITVPATHFCLSYHGGPGIKVTPAVDLESRTAAVTVEAWVEGNAESVLFSTAGQTAAAPVADGCAKAVFTLENAHLWDGVEDPYLYTLTASLDSGAYRLCGAARHQDRQGLGSALTRAEHEEDMALLREMGANTVRLAHYQHAQYFYDLCDEYGMVVWAEIPYITAHMPTGRQNTLDQMTELVVQNYNHPSIVCWGLSNEITAHGGATPDMAENHKLLNDLCHKLDSTRPTTMAHAFMLEPDDPFVMTADICSYNLYYGWYLGELNANEQFFDAFHAAHPDRVVGFSEYGADANPAYQSAAPCRGDWTESYQALYHEHMLKMWAERPYIWAMHAWNMFDFAADGREEGGKPGQNQKGLVTFDRKTRKDAFYLYKAYLSKEPFVHICGRRYVNRAEDVTEVKVYSNQPEISLFVDGKMMASKTGDKVFVFEVPITGEHTFEARSGDLRDAITVCKVSTPDPAYSAQGGEVVNWFDKPEELTRPGHFSILDTMADIKKNPQAAALLAKIMAKSRESYGDVARGVTMPPSVQRLMEQSTLQSMLKQVGKAVTPAMVKQLNAALNKIPKPEPGAGESV